MRQAASLPLGSIIPQQRSYKLYSAPIRSSAVVPVIQQAVFEAFTLISLASSPKLAANSIIVIRFIILVRLAIYLRLWLRLLHKDLPCCISYTIQLLAVTLGGAQLSGAHFLDQYEQFLVPQRESFDLVLESTEFCDLVDCGLFGFGARRVSFCYRTWKSSSFWMRVGSLLEYFCWIEMDWHCKTGGMRSALRLGSGGSLQAAIFINYSKKNCYNIHF